MWDSSGLAMSRGEEGARNHERPSREDLGATLTTGEPCEENNREGLLLGSSFWLQGEADCGGRDTGDGGEAGEVPARGRTRALCLPLAGGAEETNSVIWRQSGQN